MAKKKNKRIKAQKDVDQYVDYLKSVDVTNMNDLSTSCTSAEGLKKEIDNAQMKEAHQVTADLIAMNPGAEKVFLRYVASRRRALVLKLGAK